MGYAHAETRAEADWSVQGKGRTRCRLTFKVEEHHLGIRGSTDTTHSRCKQRHQPGSFSSWSILVQTRTSRLGGDVSRKAFEHLQKPQRSSPWMWPHDAAMRASDPGTTAVSFDEAQLSHMCHVGAPWPPNMPSQMAH